MSLARTSSRVDFVAHEFASGEIQVSAGPETTLRLTVLKVVFGSAFASWHLVEKRWLRRDSHYVLASQSATR